MQILEFDSKYILTSDMTAEITNLCQKDFYLAPQQMEEKIYQILSRNSEFRNALKNIVVSGETSNLSIYFIFDKCLTIFTPLQPIRNNIILRELFALTDFGDEIMLTLPLTADLLRRLTLPKVLLINPYIAEKYPVPRLPLSVAIIASYLRKYQKCQVWIVDTQLGTDLNTVREEILRVKPDIIGISIPHGQTTLAISVLDEIYSLIGNKRITSVVVAGNFIAASLPDYFLNRYPGLIIATGEGENTMIDLVDYFQGKMRLSEVSGMTTYENHQLLVTNPKPTRMDDLPLPAMDNLNELCKLRGALTHEWNRGCFGKCSFCPRTHKPSRFKGMSPATVVSQLKYFSKVIDRFGLTNHLYVADEETIGGLEDAETERLISIAKGIIKDHICITFDAYTRVDQVFNPQMSLEWHSGRMYMWHLLKRAGLARLFIGVESGSTSQLKRYGKGITPEQSIMALRILSSLGIEIRIGFVMFDPLMTFQELNENVEFLERQDALVDPSKLEIENNRYSELFKLLHDDDFVRKIQLGQPVHSRVSYMLAQLEVLIGSNYVTMLKKAEKSSGKKLLSDKIDLNIGKMQAEYLDKDIELLANCSQVWIDNNFGVMYTVKGLRKTAEPTQERKLFELMKTHRKISLDFLKTMMIITKKQDNSAYVNAIDTIPLTEDLRNLVKSKEHHDKRQLLESCLRMFMCSIEKEIIKRIENLLRNGEIADTLDKTLAKAVENWRILNTKLQYHSRVIA